MQIYKFYKFCASILEPKKEEKKRKKQQTELTEQKTGRENCLEKFCSNCINQQGENQDLELTLSAGIDENSK